MIVGVADVKARSYLIFLHRRIRYVHGTVTADWLTDGQANHTWIWWFWNKTCWSRHAPLKWNVLFASSLKGIMDFASYSDHRDDAGWIVRQDNPHFPVISRIAQGNRPWKWNMLSWSSVCKQDIKTSWLLLKGVVQIINIPYNCFLRWVLILSRNRIGESN